MTTREPEIESHHSFGRLVIVCKTRRARSFMRGFCAQNPKLDIDDDYDIDYSFLANDAKAGWLAIRSAHKSGVRVEEETLGEAEGMLE